MRDEALVRILSSTLVNTIVVTFARHFVCDYPKSVPLAKDRGTPGSDITLVLYFHSLLKVVATLQCLSPSQKRDLAGEHGGDEIASEVANSRPQGPD